MKTTKFIAAALLPLMFSCAKENLVPPTDVESNGKIVTISLIPDNDALTKATFVDGEGITWTKGENVYAGIIKAQADYQPVKSENLDNVYTYSDESNGGKECTQASFKFKLGEPEGTFKIFYPYDENAAYNSESGKIVIPFNVPDVQFSEIGKSRDNFAVVGKGMIDLPRFDEESVNNGGSTHFKVVGSYIRMSVFGGAEGEVVDYISISGTSIQGGYNVSTDAETIDFAGKTANTGDKIMVYFDTKPSAAVNMDSAPGIYASVLPGSYKNTYRVVTNKGFYNFESSSEKEFAFGSIKDIPFNLAKATTHTPDMLYIIGDATTAGWTKENAIELTKSGDTFTISGIELYSGGEGFKFILSTESWNPAYVNNKLDNKTLVFEQNPNVNKGTDNKFTVDRDGKYDIVVNLKSGELTLTLKEEIKPSLYHNQLSEPEAMEAIGDGKYKATVYVGFGDGYHDLKICRRGQYYRWKTDNDYPEVSLGSSLTVTNDVDVISGEKECCWINNDYAVKYYDVILDTKNNKLTLGMAIGKRLALVGLNGNWAGRNIDAYPYAPVDSDGIVKWSDVEVTVADTEFKICGEYTLESQWGSTDDFWQGSWIYAPDYGTQIESNTEYSVSLNRNEDKKWKISETGTYDFEFNTNTSKLKVTKK